jgi:transposase
MNITIFKNNGVDYLRLVKNYTKKCDGKSIRTIKVIKNIGPISRFDDGKPDYLKRLRASYTQGKPLIESLNEFPNDANKNKITLTFDTQKDFLDPKNIGFALIKPYIDELGISATLSLFKQRSKIKYDLLGIVRLLIYGRILNPKSKLKTLDQNNDYFKPPVHDLKEKNIYKALDVLNKKSVSLQKTMNNKIMKSSIGRKTETLFYDVTNTYFETAYSDDDIVDENTGKIIEQGLRKKGVSKEYRPEPIVQFGLYVDENGLPVSYKIFPGNSLDTTTLKSSIQESVDNFSLGRIIVVSDRGLNSDKNISFLLSKGNGYIFSKSIKKNKLETKNWILDKKGYLDKNNKCWTKDSNFVLKSRIIERKLATGEIVKEKQIVYWSKAHYLREARQNKKFIDYLNKAIEFPDKIKDKQAKIEYFLNTTTVDKKTGEVLKGTKQKREVDEKKVKEWIDLMGHYLICTSETQKSDLEIINKYKGLSKIEDAFRISKSDLKLRPVYCWTPKHINAHFLICFISLLIIRLIQYKTLKVKGKKIIDTDGWTQGITAEKLKDELRNFTADELTNGFYKISNPSELIKSTFKKINEKFIYTYDELRKTLTNN